MNKLDRVSLIRKRLNELYPNPPIPLNHHDEFTLLIAVLLSAQSTDKKVNEITPALFKKANTPLDMQKLGEREIQSSIRQIGLSRQKAKNIANLSKILIEKFKGKVPCNFKDLESLPGVGHKTASVVLSQAFGFQTFPVDTHIHRLAQRWGLSKGKNVLQTEKDLKAIFPESEWNKLHLQIIFYGREHCTARGCDGRVCSICKELYPNRCKPIICKKA
ncbi:endonuclease III [Prochlorococcus sp. MIT 1341]|uniref:endonuclease III n=1 Tax=Prochlorococcus sp. MIT 1341 TaxID=3096221 RepID=UPI002A74CA61|nr:endonuclease III [Prochlorococcus sp. MIT 1341]